STIILISCFPIHSLLHSIRLFFSISWCIPIYTLFPYTTLFRSRAQGSSAANRFLLPRAGPRTRTTSRRRRCGRRAFASSPTTCRSEEHTSELQSRGHLVCRLLLEKKK